MKPTHESSRSKGSRLTFQPMALPTESSIKRPAKVIKPPSIGNSVVISTKQLLAQKTTKDQVMIPISSPSGPAAVRGDPIDTKRPAPGCQYRGRSVPAIPQNGNVPIAPLMERS